MYHHSHSKPFGTELDDKSGLGTMAALIESFGDWQIRNDILYLDNGAFGACPTAVVDKQKEIRQWIEENPHEFYERSYITALEASKETLAGFLHADPSDLVLLPGATHGLNVVIQSLNYNQGDEILTTNHAYSSVRMALEYVAKRDGAHLVVIDLPLQVTGPTDILQRILAGVTSRTRLAVIDHIPSRSGLVLPAKEIVHELESLGVDTLVDGAHAPGMIPLNLEDINAAYYVANCHKWMCAPRGVGFLHVRRDHAEKIKPLVIARSPYVVSRSKHSSLQHSFGWMGTYCPSAVLSLPCSINHLETVMPGGYSGLTSRNHDLAVLARRIICKAIGIPVPCPDSMIAAMATIPLPDSPGLEQEGMLPIQQALWKEHGIVIPVYSWPSYPKRVIRLSVQAYNSLDQYLKLADCLRMVLYNERNPVPKDLKHWPSRPLPWMGERRQSHDSTYSSSTEPSLACNCGSHEADSWGKGFVRPEAPYKDMEDPTPWLLIWLAQSRVRRIVEGSFSSYPLSLFPTAGDAETQFHLASEPKYRHANLEASRVTYMLSCLNRRRIPQMMASLVSKLLETDDIIESWPDWMGTLRNQAQILNRAIVFDMAAPRTPAKFPVDARDFVSLVVPYETESQQGNLSLTFWLRALADFTTRGQWSTARVMSFLQIHSFLKDPVGGLRNDVDTPADLFLLMFNGLKPEINVAKTSQETWEEIAAQLALESSFMSQPLVSTASYIHFSGDQQLVYSYVDIANLARSEFASPEIVTGMIQDILNSDSSDDENCIAPIAVARSYPVCSSHDARAVIVDGNNRITTVAFLRFVSIYGVSDAGEMEGQLREYCRNHGLGPVYFVDFCAVMQMLRNSAEDTIDQLRTCRTLARFRHVSQVPSLVTEESSFFTRVLVEEGEKIAQPVHQYIFATDDLLVALPAKMQSHGRAKGFKALPVR
ncbi:hypothetical protein FZEAL_2176 [Fusarium zealandicum]|uniref:Aminotransferase class V domain-containing protein n=1 Tax=Fusarium zealandicum TaxID=1053134 RepID=A0A8H4URY0_9HYPO|nr:hypothetical protein FZEAL_2176 [Fusarium zealandicum]